MQPGLDWMTKFCERLLNAAASSEGKFCERLACACSMQWLAEPKPGRAKAGGRGRNRTYNLSVKSRMLCQLSYASRGGSKSRAIGVPARLPAEVKIASAPQKIYHRRSPPPSAGEAGSAGRFAAGLEDNRGYGDLAQPRLVGYGRSLDRARILAHHLGARTASLSMGVSRSGIWARKSTPFFSGSLRSYLPSIEQHGVSKSFPNFARKPRPGVFGFPMFLWCHREKNSSAL